MLIRTLFLMILLFLIFRMIVPVFRGISRLFGVGTPQTRSRKGRQGNGNPDPGQPDYSELSPYEIEDAEYEEIKTDKDAR